MIPSVLAPSSQEDFGCATVVSITGSESSPASSWSVSVLCIQDVQAGEFPSLPIDQPYHYDGPVGTRGREAAFLARSWVSGAPVSGVEDSTSVKWRVFDGSWCRWSFYAPHAGTSPHRDIRVADWREFVHKAGHIHNLRVLPRSSPGMRMCGTHTSDSAPDLLML